jgi:hypothetical protein
MAAHSHRKTDRRILRTRDTLGDALLALMQERNFTAWPRQLSESLIPGNIRGLCSGSHPFSK